jgi:hypothetical protein
MVLDQEIDDRDAAVRAMLVAQVQRSAEQPASLADALRSPGLGRSRMGLMAAVASGVVLVLVIVLSAVAIRVGAGGGAPAHSGDPSISASDGVTTPTPSDPNAIPDVEAPAGVLLGRYTSADGPNQTHTIHPNGLALSVRYACTGRGAYFFGISHDSEDSGDGSCGGGGGYGNKGHTGALTVTIRTAKTMRWTFVVVGIPETYVTPQPVLSPTDSAGAAVRFCTGADLAVRYQPVLGPNEVTEVGGGQLVLTNTSSSTCALAGHPLVRFLDGSRPLGHHTMDAVDQRSSEAKGLRPVIVAPGGKAYSQIGWYLPNFYVPNEEGPCQARTVHALRVDLGNRLAGAAQQGSFDVPIGTATACLNGAHGTNGKYGQLSSTVFVDYAAEPGK